MATQQEVIKKFMESLDKTTLSGTAAVDEAIRACSNFNSTQEVIDKMVSDCRTVGNAKNFLLNYCGINLYNDDTGAITGWDAGRFFVKNAEDIVSETGELINFTGNSFTVKGLTVTIGDNKNFSDLTDNQKFIWQGLYTWWVKGALDLIAESYGENYGFDSNSSTTSKKMYVRFINTDDNTLASMSKSYDNLYLNINEKYYGNIDTEEHNGLSPRTDFYLDRTIAHEFTHAVMFANVNNFSSMPQFITEGIAELTHGIDDTRKNKIYDVASNANSLTAALSFESGTGDVLAYVGGFMFLRYLANQTFDEYDHINNTIYAVTLTGTNSDDQIRNSGDSVTIYGGAGNDSIINVKNWKYYRQTPLFISVSWSGGDYLYIEGGAGNDSILNAGRFSTIYGGIGSDTIKNENYYGVLYGGDGNDLISASFSTIDGGTGDDTINLSYSSVFGGDGNDLINDKTDTGSYYSTIDGGTGNDTINLSYGSVLGGTGTDLIFVDKGTVNGGKDNDTIYGNDIANSWRVYQYAIGDGADVIIGFNSTDTLHITSGSYTTTKSGNDLIVNVNSGSVKLQDIYLNEYNKIHIKDADGNIVTLNDWSIMSGTSGADSIYNLDSNITISGLGGNDTIENYGTKVSIVTGNGDDSIFSNSNATIETRDGNDSIEYRGYSFINAGQGNDYIYGGDYNVIKNESTIYGGVGNDTIYEACGEIYGEDGNDYIFVALWEYANVDGGAGDDTILADAGYGSSILGGDGNDEIWINLSGSYTGSTKISGGKGNDTVHYDDGVVYVGWKLGYRATYQYVSGEGNDVIEGFTGYDKIEITGDSYSTITSGDDIIIKVGNGSIILKDARANDIDLNIDGTFDSNTDWQTINNSNSNTIVYGGDYDETITNTASNVTINAGDGNDSIDCANYSTKVIYNNSIRACSHY